MDRNKVTPKVSPLLDTRKVASKNLGVRSQRDQDRAIEDLSKFGTGIIAPIVTVTTPWWYRESIGSAGDGSYGMRLPIPSAQTSFTGGIAQTIAMPTPGWIVGGFLTISAARTAGSASVRVNIDGQAYDLEDGFIIDGASPSDQRVSFFLPFSTELPFAEDNLIYPSIVTSSFAPTTAHAVVALIVRFDVT